VIAAHDEIPVRQVTALACETRANKLQFNHLGPRPSCTRPMSSVVSRLIEEYSPSCPTRTVLFSLSAALLFWNFSKTTFVQARGRSSVSNLWTTINNCALPLSEAGS
jgi:hypothetical protein